MTGVLQRNFVFRLSELDHPLEPDCEVRLMIPAPKDIAQTIELPNSDDSVMGAGGLEMLIPSVHGTKGREPFWKRKMNQKSQHLSV